MNDSQVSKTVKPLDATPAAPITRRRFLAAAGASAVSLTVLGPKLVGAAEANAKLDIGLIGCGHRGPWLADLCLKHGGYNIAAVADYFPEKAEAAGEKFRVPAARRFSGLGGYRRLLECKLDAVAIESPPYFHPEQAAAAVEAGKHVYLAKPIGVDVPGCQTIAQSGQKATAKKQVFVVDFQTRATAPYQEVVRRVHAGQVGPIKSAEASYIASFYSGPMCAAFKKSKQDAEARLRAWGIHRMLSGDIITEQNIHALDVAAWFLDTDPLKAVGTGGRAQATGENWDHFAVIYTFPDDVPLTFSSKQYGAAFEDIVCRVYGTTGTADTHYGGKVWLRSNEEYFEGITPGIYTDGVVSNIATFHRSITQGDCANPTVAASVRSTLVTILGRTAAYRRGEVTWAELLKANEKWEYDLSGLQV